MGFAQGSAGFLSPALASQMMVADPAEGQLSVELAEPQDEGTPSPQTTGPSSDLAVAPAPIDNYEGADRTLAASVALTVPQPNALTRGWQWVANGVSRGANSVLRWANGETAADKLRTALRNEDWETARDVTDGFYHISNEKYCQAMIDCILEQPAPIPASVIGRLGMDHRIFDAFLKREWWGQVDELLEGVNNPYAKPLETFGEIQRVLAEYVKKHPQAKIPATVLSKGCQLDGDIKYVMPLFERLLQGSDQNDFERVVDERTIGVILEHIHRLNGHHRVRMQSEKDHAIWIWKEKAATGTELNHLCRIICECRRWDIFKTMLGGENMDLRRVAANYLLNRAHAFDTAYRRSAVPPSLIELANLVLRDEGLRRQD